MKLKTRMSLSRRVGKPGKALGEMLALLARLELPFEPARTPARVAAVRWQAPRPGANRS